MGSDNLEQRLRSALVVLFSPPNTPTEEQVREKAALLAPELNEGDLDAIVADVLREVVTSMEEGFALDDTTAKHDAEWAERLESDPEKNRVYFPAYREFLKKEGWNAQVVESLNNVSSKILGRLQDPKSEGAWDRRGLVIGHVQSGKTSNYIGLISKAADAGYKFIIVIAGIHNILRAQTQERIERGFIGRSSASGNRAFVGVGTRQGYPHPVTLTTVADDFRTQTARNSGWELNNFERPIVLVIKKNVATLKSLYCWLREMNAKDKDGGGDIIADVPMLIIDDEADNASINTNKEDENPTKTNAELRRILRLFHKSSYVGYTATPFANIFINPEAYDAEVREELFPRDFIYCLDAPTSYFGAEKVFLEEGEDESFTRPIDDCEDILPLRHRKEHSLETLPPSLHRALCAFVVARTIRNLRGQGRQHCSMMVNVSRFVDVQSTVRDRISLYMQRMKEAVAVNSAMPDSSALSNQYMRELKKVYEEEYALCGFKWEQIKTGFQEVCNSIRTFVINQNSADRLDYTKAETEGHSLTAIAVGGLSLSRGLTIEGLCVSYMYRNTRMYDTLMQMGRWFGYRSGYEDLCRIYLSPDSITWYAYIAEASEELRQQIKSMGRQGKTPKEFGLYVTATPGSLMVTANNKMRGGTPVKKEISFSEKIEEISLLPTDNSINSSNEELIEEFRKEGFGKGFIKKTDKGWMIPDAPIESIEDFLLRFKKHRGIEEHFRNVISYLQKIAEIYPSGDVLLISPKGKGTSTGDYRLVPQERKADRKNDGWRINKSRVASRGDEKIGLDEKQLERAHKSAEGDNTSDYHYRMQRQKPLLMVHVLSIKERGSEPSENVQQRRVPSLGISFPSDNDESRRVEVEVIANRVYIQNRYGFYDEDIEDSEDDDS